MADSEHKWFDDDTAIFIPLLAFMLFMTPLLALEYSLIAFALSLFALLIGGLGVLGYLYLTRHASPEDNDETDDPVQTLQREYAQGNITEDEFDERLEKLLETQNRAEEVADIETSGFEFN